MKTLNKANVQNIDTYTKTEIDAKFKNVVISTNFPPVQVGTLEYTGNTQSPTWSNYDTSKMTIGGTTSATNVGTYTATFTPVDGYKWADGTTDAVSVEWTISKVTVTLPTQSGTLTYTGSAQSPTWNNYDSKKLTIGGTTSSTAAGTYTATFTPAANYQWSDGTASTKNASWTINKATLSVPAQNGTLTYNGSAQTPAWTNYDSAKMTIGGTTSSTAAGTYTATFTPAANYQWSDGTASTKNASWTINKASVAIPSQNGTLTYTGSSQSPTWNNYASTKMTLGGTTKGTNAGSYTATFTLNDGYIWSDNTTAAKSITWKIDKATGSVSLNTTSLEMDASSLTQTVTVTRSGDGTVSASSSNTSIATVSVSGTTITVTGKANGTATITVSVAAGTNYTAPSDKTVAVTVSLIGALEDCTPAEIQEVAQAGTGSSYWAIGDKIGIALSGTVGSLTLSDTYYAFIIGFDHNSSVEGTGIHFQFGKTSAGVNIAFVDSQYGTTDKQNTDKFKMNTTNTNSGGWESCTMRTARCAEFLSAMPTAWQNVIASCTKYSDNTGGGSDTDSYVTSTLDKIWLLAEYEVFGTRYYANSAEQNYQKQYEYYANGNSRVKHMHDSIGTACAWWLRSAHAANELYFRCVSAKGGINGYNTYCSFGFAPGFKVA